MPSRRASPRRLKILTETEIPDDNEQPISDWQLEQPLVGNTDESSSVRGDSANTRRIDDLVTQTARPVESERVADPVRAGGDAGAVAVDNAHNRGNQLLLAFCVKSMEIISTRLAEAVRVNVLPLLAIVGGFWLWRSHAKPDILELIELGLYGLLVVIPVLWRMK